jgi:hypothetical protein
MSTLPVFCAGAEAKPMTAEFKIPIPARLRRNLHERLYRNFYRFYGGRKTRNSDLLSFMKRVRPMDCGLSLTRIGAAGDGGYLIPDDLDGIEYCFSPGVSSISDFESQLADRNVRSFLADYSVDSPAANRAEFVFDKKFLGPTDEEICFTLSSWKENYLRDYAGDLLLQMDIEGSEYGVILSTPEELLGQFRIAVIEFHALDRLFDALAFPLISSCFDKLLKSFYVVHMHPNNVCGSVRMNGLEIPLIMEFTFLNKRRVHNKKPQIKFPHELDADNTPAQRIVLPKCWYQFDE